MLRIPGVNAYLEHSFLLKVKEHVFPKKKKSFLLFLWRYCRHNEATCSEEFHVYQQGRQLPVQIRQIFFSADQDNLKKRPKFQLRTFQLQQLYNTLIELELPRLLAPDLPSICYSLGVINRSHSYCK